MRLPNINIIFTIITLTLICSTLNYTKKKNCKRKTRITNNLPKNARFLMRKIIICQRKY